MGTETKSGGSVLWGPGRRWAALKVATGWDGKTYGGEEGRPVTQKGEGSKAAWTDAIST